MVVLPPPPPSPLMLMLRLPSSLLPHLPPTRPQPIRSLDGPQVWCECLHFRSLRPPPPPPFPSSLLLSVGRPFVPPPVGLSQRGFPYPHSRVNHHSSYFIFLRRIYIYINFLPFFLPPARLSLTSFIFFDSLLFSLSSPPHHINLDSGVTALSHVPSSTEHE